MNARRLHVNLRARPAGSEPLTVVDYLYLGQIPPLLFAPESQQEARSRFGGRKEAKQRLWLQSARSHPSAMRLLTSAR